MKKNLLLAALIASAFAAAASDQPNKTSAQQVQGQKRQALIQTPFKVWPDGDWVFVVNTGNADWTGPLDVWVTCKPVARTTSCGRNFAGGKYRAGHYDKGTFPKGYGQAPIKGFGNAQITSGYGWVAVPIGLEVGTYKITATAADNSSPETDVTIAAPQGVFQSSFRFIASGNYVFVINGGASDWTGSLDVTIACTPVAPTKTCANTSVNKHYNTGDFPAGHGQAPASAPSGNSVIITQGGGYDAIFMGEAVGTYKFIAKAAHNTSPEMSVNVTTPPPGTPPTIQLNPAVNRGVGVAPKNP